jgi:hypothetical protein
VDEDLLTSGVRCLSMLGIHHGYCDFSRSDLAYSGSEKGTWFLVAAIVSGFARDDGGSMDMERFDSELFASEI